MPVQMRFNGSRIVHEVVPWPVECRLQANPKPSAQMTEQEIKDEIRLLDHGSETELHKAFCIFDACPAKR